MASLGKDLISNKWIGAIALWMLLWLVAFLAPLRSAASVWITNDTFNHCFLILPAALYFIWRERGAIAAQSPQRSIVGLAALTMVLVVFALGQAAYIDVLQHIAAFEILPAIVLFLFGWRVFRAIWFPLLFIFFSIPLGEELFATFQDITADIAIILLKLMNIPVYRDGLFISIPNGQFVVAEACSGIRFFIACAVLGTTIAYVNFVSAWRALAFTLFSILMPILANGVRAFGIIYIGYISDMQKAVGADHLIYGWFFFALVVALLIVAGHYFSDGHRKWHDQYQSIAPAWRSNWNVKTLALAIAPLLLVKALTLVQDYYPESPFELETANLTAINQDTAESYAWTPRMQNADIYLRGSSEDASIYQATYRYNTPEHELISWQNRLFDTRYWSLRGTHDLPVKGIGNIAVLELTSHTSEHRLLAYWYVLPGYISSSPYKTKLRQAINTLLLQPSGGALIAVDLPYDADVDVALDRLQHIVESTQAR